ncbi:hypothetical protein D3C86_2106410 [compost metagenome]
MPFCDDQRNQASSDCITKPLNCMMPAPTPRMIIGRFALPMRNWVSSIIKSAKLSGVSFFSTVCCARLLPPSTLRT